jgi:cell division protein FtsB
MKTRKLLLSLILALPYGLVVLGWCSPPALGQAAPGAEITALRAENARLRAENAALRAMILSLRSSTAPVAFATHEFAARGSLFISDGTGSIYQEPF